MTTIQDLGEVTDTRTEWASRSHICDGSIRLGEPIDDEVRARESYAATRDFYASIHARDGWPLDGTLSVDLVSRTVVEYASRHTLIGPWEVAE